MDFAELKKSFAQARVLSVPVGGVTFVLSIPTDVEIMRLVADSDRLGETHGLFNYRLIAARLTGWSGAREKDIVPSAPESDLPFSAEAAELYLSTRPATVGELADALTEKMEQLRAEQEASRKN